MKKHRIIKHKQKGFIINPFLSQITVPDIDPYWNLAQAQINGDTGTIFDQSPSNATVTLTGAVVVSNTRSRYGSTSIYIPNSGSLKLSKPGSFSYLGDFEIHLDVWLENDVAANASFINISYVEGSNRLLFLRNTSQQLQYDIYNVGGAAGPIVQSGQWNSVVVGRIDQWCYVGINGVLTQLAANPGSYQAIANSNNSSVTIFGAAGGAGGLYFNNLRVLPCRNYLSINNNNTYIPPTSFYAKQGVDTTVYDPLWKQVVARLPLNTDVNDVSNNPRVVTYSTGAIGSHASSYNNAFVSTSASDGAINIYYDLPAWSNWTLEARMAWSNLSVGDKCVIALYSGATQVACVQLAANASGSMYTYVPATGGFYHFGFVPVANTVYNILIERAGQVFRLYVDGVYKGNTFCTTSLPGVTYMVVGGGPSMAAGQGFFIDDVRFTLGTRTTGYSYDNNLSLNHPVELPIAGYGGIVAATNDTKYRDDVLSDNPLFYYRLNEASGTIVVDSSGNARNGTYVGGPVLQSSSLLKSENTNKAVSINGANNYINIPYGSWMNIGTIIALEALIKLPTTTADTIVSRRYAVVGQHVFQFRIVNGYLTLIVFNSGGGGYTWYCFNYLLTIDTVYHAFVTFNGSLIKFYVNGRLMDQSYCVLSLPAAPTTAIDIGRDTTVASPYEPYYGIMDEVAMYGSILPYNRITSHANKADLLLTDNTLTNALTGAVCILALRVLKPGYSGSLIKVRRSSDNTELAIGSLNGELDTVSLLNFVGSGNGYVSIWYDQSGTGNNFTQATQASQPLIVVNGVLLTYNNKPCIKAINSAFFDAGNILNDNYHFTMNYLTDSLLMSKGRDGNGNGWCLNWDVGSNTSSIVLVSGGVVGYTVIGATQTPQFKTKRIQYVHGATSYYKIYNDGDVNGEITQAKYGLRTSTIGMRLGRGQNTYYSGRASELIIHNSLLPDYLSDVIRENQASYYSSVNADPYFSRVKLLLHFDNVVNNTTIVDNSIYNNIVSIVGSPVLTNTVNLIDKECISFSGANNNYITIPANTNLDLTNQAFSLEASVYITSFADAFGLFCKISATYGIDYEHAIFLEPTRLGIYYGRRGTNQSTIRLFLPITLQLNTKYNICVQRTSAGVWTVYVDGVPGTQYQVAPLASGQTFGGIITGSYTNAVNFGTNTIPLTIGGCVLNFFKASGYIDEYRLTIGDVRVTNNYSPSNLPYPNY